MNLGAVTDGKSIEVQACGKFLEDDRFKQVLDAINNQDKGNTWPPPSNDMNANQDFLNVATQLDSVFFLSDRFELVIDARGFSPEHVRCTVTPDNVEVTAHKEIKEDGQGFDSERSQEISRRYQLPQKINPQQSACYLSSDGVLFVTAMWDK